MTAELLFYKYHFPTLYLRFNSNISNTQFRQIVKLPLPTPQDFNHKYSDLKYQDLDPVEVNLFALVYLQFFIYDLVEGKFDKFSFVIFNSRFMDIQLQLNLLNKFLSNTHKNIFSDEDYIFMFNNFNISFIILELPLFKFYTKEEENTQDLIFNIVDSTRNAIMTNLKIQIIKSKLELKDLDFHISIIAYKDNKKYFLDTNLEFLFFN